MESQRRPSKEQPRIEAIDRAMQLLEAVAAAGSQGASLADLTTETSISKPTAYRALATMRGRGFISQSPQGAYRLGPRSLHLHDIYFSEDNLQAQLHPVLVDLSRKTEELVHLGAWDGDEIVYLDKVEPAKRAIRVWSAIGQRVPAASSALGRAMLAAGDHGDEELERFATLLPENRVVSRERLLSAIVRARQSGFSHEHEENEPGVACMGFALMRNQRPSVAVSITSLSSRMNDRRRAELRDLIRTELPPVLPEGVELFLGSEGHA